MTINTALLVGAARGDFDLHADRGLPLALATLSKLAFLATGAVFAWRSARRGAATSWWWMAAAMSSFSLGQATLAFYQLVIREVLAFPSIADVFFVSGTFLFFVALCLFLLDLASSGFPLDLRNRLPWTLVLVMGGGSAVSWLLVRPILAKEHFDSADLLSLLYPATDLMLVVPAVLLLHATWPFRGGSISKIWISMLAGILLFMIGDLFFALLAEGAGPWVALAVDLAYLGGYALAARACWLQFAMSRQLAA